MAKNKHPHMKREERKNNRERLGLRKTEKQQDTLNPGDLCSLSCSLIEFSCLRYIFPFSFAVCSTQNSLLAQIYSVFVTFLGSYSNDPGISNILVPLLGLDFIFTVSWNLLPGKVTLPYIAWPERLF